MTHPLMAGRWNKNPGEIRFVVPLHLRGPNTRRNRQALAADALQAREAVVGSALVQQGPDCWSKVKPPCVVTFTRLSPRALDDDNLRGACKPIRDEVARMLGVDDGPSSLVRWNYAQRKDARSGIEVLITPVATESVA